MMPTMKREQFEEMSFEELLEWAYDHVDDMLSEGSLLEMAKHEIDEDSLKMALHILNAVYESDCPDGSYYLYDRNMGTLETPTPITRKEDLEDYIDFEEEDNMDVRQYSNKFVEMVEEGMLDPVDTVRMCVKWMNEDDVKKMFKANEIDLDMEDEEDDAD